MKLLRYSFLFGCLAVCASFAGVWLYAGEYGLHDLVRHGGTWWIRVNTKSTYLSPSMRLALGSGPPAVPGNFHWRVITPGFEVGDLPAMANGSSVDDILLARIDPDRFRFVVRNSSSGDKDLDQWMSHLGAALVVNGSYYALNGEPATPFLADSVPLGPKDYDAKAGAFVASPKFTGIRNLAHENWRKVFADAQDGMVSYPLLVADGKTHIQVTSRWLANRSFVGQDTSGRIIIGTTVDGYFSLERFAHFLLQARLGLTVALNLDGGPVACQGISLMGYERKTYGRWEAQVDGDRVHLLTWPYGTVAMPIVLAVFPK